MSGEIRSRPARKATQPRPDSPPTTYNSPLTRLKIDSVEAIAIDIPLKKNFGGSTYNVLTRCTVVTRLTTEDGVVSEVYNGDNRDDGRRIVRLIHEDLAPRVKGLSVFEGHVFVASPRRV